MIEPSGRSFHSKSSFRMVREHSSSLFQRFQARQKVENSYRTEPKEKPNLTETLKLVELLITKTLKERDSSGEIEHASSKSKMISEVEAKKKSFVEDLSNNCHALVRKTIPARYRFVLQNFVIDNDDQNTNIQSR